MVAIVGMIAQEYFTGISVKESIVEIAFGSGDSIAPHDSHSFLESILGIPQFIVRKMTESGFISTSNYLPK